MSNRGCRSTVMSRFYLALWLLVTSGTVVPAQSLPPAEVPERGTDVVGVPVVLGKGITETVDQMMGREAFAPPPMLARPITSHNEFEFDEPLKDNPDAPALSQWPPATEQLSGPIVPLSPQTVGVNFLGVFLNGGACTDRNACSQTDTCSAGACVGSNPVVGAASDQCHAVGTCNPSTGACSNPNKPNGTACNDGNACPQTDACQSGVCMGSNPVVCIASDQCHVAGLCDPSTGFCSDPAKADGTACSDGDPCPIGDACGGGACTGTAITVPAETQNLAAAADKATYSWSAVVYATGYDVVRGDLGSLPVGPGGGDETCFDNLASPTLSDATVPAAESGFWHLSRGENTCGHGTYGTRHDGSPRITTTCP